MAASLGWLGAKALAVLYPEGLGHVNFSSERKNKAACLQKVLGKYSLSGEHCPPIDHRFIHMFELC
jgi:hypothetical protein